MPQTITSERTSINTHKVPAVYNKISYLSYQRNGHTTKLFDYGCGRKETRDLIKAKLDKYEIEYIPYDPYNMPEHEADYNLQRIEEANIIVCSNVLNVIDSDQVVESIMRKLDKLSQTRDVFISVYEGDGTGIGKITSKGYQRNELVSEYRRKMNMIHGTMSAGHRYYNLYRGIIHNTTNKLF